MSRPRWRVERLALLAVVVLLVHTMMTSVSLPTLSPYPLFDCSGITNATAVLHSSSRQFIHKDVRDSKRSTKSEKERLQLLGSGTVPTIDTFWIKEQRKPTPKVRFLVDYVVAGFPKCGTTALGHWLSSHPLIKDTAEEEHHILMKDMNYTTNRLYESLLLPWGTDENMTAVVRGFRCPHQLHTEWGIRMLSQVFTETKVIVSVRHPVWWFQSYYNYRLEQNETHLLKDLPNGLIGNLKGNFASDKSPWILQTATGEFHRYLSAMKKTPMTDPEEITLLSPFWNRNWNITHLPRMPNPVFFSEISQLSDKNITRRALFRKDLQTFLGLPSEFPPIRHVRPQGTDSGLNQDKRINICDEKYAPVRAELMNVARHASLWLRKYFMESKSVYFSSGDFLDELLQKWMDDPCQ
ncbi:sulfotransferase family protein [Nitzschia inconspicua]|uniref:Sulfotransferase family protein n=1 Tax=Nitzschia inconspicua TaxID=303405 RepID=A0A9K3L3H6_9STRA|nr:sulfotransferase family protein [Nitzschia inconspicua]